jgi:hypothetical protein
MMEGKNVPVPKSLSVESVLDIAGNPMTGQREYEEKPMVKTVFRFTFVISVVAASFSRSSADRSVNPGRACFA